MCRRRQHDTGPAQGWLLAPPELDHVSTAPLQEPTHLDRLQAEDELFGCNVSGHPLELYPDIAWDTYCPRRGEFVGQDVVLCGLVIVSRIHSQEGGAPMKFLTLAGRAGMVETELFADTYRIHGLATVRYPVLGATATVEPFENGRGFRLRFTGSGNPAVWQGRFSTE